MFTEIDKIRINYLDLGEKSSETVLILQGWGTHAGLYTALAEHLSTYMRVLLPELPGFGQSDEPKEAFSADDYADFTEKFLSSLGVTRLSIICHSNGGRITMKLVTREQSKFTYDKLVFIDSAGIVHEKTARQRAKQSVYKAGKNFLSLAPIKAAFPGALENYRSRHGSADYRAASPVMRQTLVKLVNEDFRPLMPEIDRPSLLIWGTNDSDTPLADGKIFEQLIPNAGMVEVQGAGHYSYLEQPQLVFRVLDSFFNRK